MKIPSKDVIQADSPERVMMAIDAVAGGAHDDRDIAKAIGGLDARQGRYYRRAAEVLGFMERNKNHRSVVTSTGKEFGRASSVMKQAIFVQALLSDPLFQRLLSFLESKGSAGVSRNEVEIFLSDVADLGAASMVRRRVSSYLGWLLKFGIAKANGGRWALDHLPSTVPIIQYKSDDEPVLPIRYDLKEYQEQAKRVAKQHEAITYFVDEAKHERANRSHETLIKLMAERLRLHGAVPKMNRYIDMSARLKEGDYLFEMKSITEINSHSQIRRGLSQLYEYRYIQNAHDAKLVLVIENPLAHKLRWIEDYLIEDRGILLVWDGNGKFSCPASIRPQLQFLE